MGNSPSQESHRPAAHMISADDAEYPREYRTLGSGARRFSNVGLVHTSERRHTVIAAQSLEALTGLQKSDMERKRDAFMDHLKNKYPQHALAIRGQQERIRDQLFQGSVPLMLAGTHGSPDELMFRELADSGGPENPPSTRSTRHSQGSQSGLADQAAKLSFASAESLETMSEAELPLGFNRMNRFRQSLPLSRSTSQTKLRSPGVLFLQFGDESRRVHITHEISSMDTLHALIVHMFPQKLTMGMLKSSNTAILIKDESRNVFYELEDVRDIQDRSIIKIFRKEPLYASFPGAHMANGDLRRDMVYTARDSSPTRRLNSMSPASHLTSGSPPPVLQSSSPARSRMSYSGGRPPSFAGSPVHHSERHSNLPPAQGVSPSPSAILERRDVKPDEDLANKNVVMVKNEGVYADPYGMVHEGRLSISSTQSLAGMGDPFSYPGGLYKRGSVRSLSTYSAAALQSELEDSLYKPNAQMYGDPYGPGMGFRMPPSSPQKMTDGRMVDVQQGQSPHSTYSGPSSRSSPVRQSFRKDSSSSVFMDSPVNKTRNSSSSGPPEIFPGPGERPLSGFSSPVPTKEVETRERMEAMEKQIASLTGLVQSALFRGSDGENPSEKPEPANGAAPTTGSVSHSNRNSMATPASTPTPTQASTAPAAQQTVITRLHMQLHLHGLQQNTSELRNQLQQLKKMQLQNQETVKTMLKRTETEISVRVTDTMRKQEDPLQRQRALVEEERLKYLNEEELITQQLNDLEKSVEKIKKDLSHSHQLISVQELEEKGLVLQQLGETLTDLKAHFPSLQSKMRVILRVEVEAVKFLKEEPHRLDTLLKRCRSVTDTLAQIRRQVEEGVWNPTDNLHNQSPKQVMAESEFAKTSNFEFPTSPPMNFHELTASQTSSWESGYNQSSSGNQTNPQRSHNPSRAGEMVAVKTQTGPEVPSKRMSADKSVSVEAAERDWEEKRAALTQYSAKDINRLLEETQAELMKAIPDLEFAAKHKQSGSTTSTPEHKPTKPQHMSKGTTKVDPSGRRGSEELTVPRYRTEKPSKSPPPPPPRRSFPSSHGITTARTGEVIVTSKKEATYIKKADSEELETQKPQVKLRRTVSEVARPASTPPIIASGIKDDDDEDRIIAELEVFQRSSGSPFIPQFLCDRLTAAVSPSPVDLWPHEATVAAKGWKDWESSRSPTRGTFFLPQIVLSEWVSNPPSPTETAHEVAKGLRSLEHRDSRLEVTDKKDLDEEGSAGPCSGNHLKSDTFDIKENPLQLERGSKNAGSCETVRCCEELHGSFASSSSKQPSIEAQSLPSLQYMEASELHIDVRAIQNKDDNPAEDIKAFIITMSEIQALSNTEVHELLEAKGQDVDTLNIDITHGQDWAEIRSQEPFVRLPNKPLLLIFDESLELRTSYRILSSVLEEDQECRASLGLQREGDGPGPKIEVVTLKENHPMCMEADGGYLKPTGVGHPEDTTCFSSQKQPVPKPRTFQGKDLKLHLSKPCRVQVSKLHCSALSQAIQSGATSTNRILKVISEQGQKYFHMDENEAQPRNQEQNLPEKTTEMFPALRETSSLCTAAPRRGAIGSTYQRLDSLEDTIRALELTLSEISEYQSPDFVFPHGFHGAHQMGTVSAGDEVPEVLKRWGASEEGMVAVEPPPMKPQQGKVNGSKKCQPPKEKPPLLPKPQVAALQSGGVSIPAMKMVNPAASRLKVAQQQGSPDKSKHIKQRMEYMRIQGQQQVRLKRKANSVRRTSTPRSPQRREGQSSMDHLSVKTGKECKLSPGEQRQTEESPEAADCSDHRVELEKAVTATHFS